MKRTVYEAPVTELFRIELEGAFMSASVVNDEPKSGVETTGHEVNEIGSSLVDQWNDTDWE